MVNNLAIQVMVELSNLKQRVTTALDDKDKENEPPSSNNDENIDPNNKALTVTQVYPRGMMELLQKMSACMDSIEKRDNNKDNNGNNNDNCQKYKRTNCNNYSWSQSTCAHKSVDYTRKSDVYKTDATFEKKLDGSTYYCA